MPTRCCWPPGQLTWIGVQLLSKPYLLQQLDAALSRLCLGQLLHDDEPFHHVLQRGFVAKQIVLLKHHRRFLAKRMNFLAGDGSQSAEKPEM